MKTVLYSFICIIMGLSSCSNAPIKTTAKDNTTVNDYTSDHIIKIEMELTALNPDGYDYYPYIHADIDFSKDTSICKRKEENKSSTYTLTKDEMNAILNLLKLTDLGKLKEEYRLVRSEVQLSKTTIYTSQRIFIINDYGFNGEFPLPELYKIVYRININR